MQDDRPADAMTDAALAEEIETALAVEPSPEFLARVRTRIAEEPGRAAGWAGPWLGHWRWGLAATAVLTIGVIAALDWPARDPIVNDVRVIDARPLAGVVVPSPHAIDQHAPDALMPRVARADERMVPSGAGAAVGQQAVLIPATERAVLHRLLRSGIVERLEPLPEPLAIAAADAPATLDEITISPIAIEPLAPVVPPKGEGQ